MCGNTGLMLLQVFGCLESRATHTHTQLPCRMSSPVSHQGKGKGVSASFLHCSNASNPSDRHCGSTCQAKRRPHQTHNHKGTIQGTQALVSACTNRADGTDDTFKLAVAEGQSALRHACGRICQRSSKCTQQSQHCGAWLSQQLHGAAHVISGTGLAGPLYMRSYPLAPP